MNILKDNPLPDAITVDGIQYPINTDFRIWMRFDNIFENKQKSTTEELILNIIKMCFKKNENGIKTQLPPNFEKAVDGLLDFYTGSYSYTTQNKENEKTPKRVYSFEYDGDYIYAAFRAQYDIDILNIDYMHWWEFKAMFSALTDTHKICEIMSIRAMDLKSIDDKKMKKHYQKLKQVYDLPDMRSESEKEKDLINALCEVF